MYGLSEGDRRQLEETIRTVKRLERMVLHPEEREPDSQAPSTLLAIAPTNGIPAYSGTFVSTDVLIKKAVGGVLSDAGFTRTVYNIGGAVSAGSLLLLKRDAFGTWWVDQVANSPLTPTVCIVGKDCKGADKTFKVPAEWIDDACCAAETAWYCLEPPTTGTATGSIGDSVIVECGGVSHTIPATLLFVPSNLRTSGDPPGTSAGCVSTYARLFIQHSGDTPGSGGLAQRWSGSVQNGDCGVLINLDIGNYLGACTAVLSGYFAYTGGVDGIGSSDGAPVLQWYGSAQPWSPGTPYFDDSLVTSGGRVYLNPSFALSGGPGPPATPWIDVGAAFTNSYGPNTYLQFASANDTVAQAGAYVITPAGAP